jgi:hypothetical protein
MTLVTYSPAPQNIARLDLPVASTKRSPALAGAEPTTITVGFAGNWL